MRQRDVDPKIIKPWRQPVDRRMRWDLAVAVDVGDVIVDLVVDRPRFGPRPILAFEYMEQWHTVPAARNDLSAAIAVDIRDYGALLWVDAAAAHGSNRMQ